ncbi:energy transducer TonB [Lysobacter firmicutimachus]|uniref:Protein TonB n=2 Tax=Lysobacter TaxID=68 RepID=A0AAU8N0B6_9GAMM
MRRGAVFGAALGLAALLGGCGSGERNGKAQTGAELDAAVALPAPLVELDSEGLRARASQALREQRIHTPAGDSAVDYYLALRDREAGQIDVIGALSELQPYVVIAGEQALLDDDLAETQRLLELLARMDPQAPALPRLREGLRRAELARRQQDRDETQRLIAERVQTAPARRDAALLSTAALKAEAAASASAADAAAQRASAIAATAAPAVAPPASASTPAAVPATAPLAARVSRAAPRLLADASPRYPLSALNRKIEGSVEVSFTILPDGRVGAPRLVSAQPAGVFDEAALAAVSRLRFEATGEAHSARRTLNFKLPTR